MQKEQQQLAALIKGKKVAFIGAGVSHKALIKEFVELGAHVTLCDQKKSVDDFGDYAATIRELGIDLSLGENYLEGFKGQDIIMRTPGFVGYFEKPLQDAMAAGTMIPKCLCRPFQPCLNRQPLSHNRQDSSLQLRRSLHSSEQQGLSCRS